MLNDNEVRERINDLLNLDSKSEQKEQLLEYARKCW